MVMRLMILLVAFGLSSCQKNPSVKASDNRQQGILRVCLPAPFSLHPAYGFERGSQLCTRALFEGLTRYDAKGELGLGLAKEITVSEDKKTYTFKLREAEWTNGTPVLSSDFVYAWRSILANASGSSLGDQLYMIKNAQVVRAKMAPPSCLGVRVIDAKTLQVELERPTPYFLQLLTNPFFSPLCEHVDRNDPDWHRHVDRFVCNGPFVLKEWDDGHLVLAKNPSYHDAEHVLLNGVHISCVDHQSTALMMFERGEVDWAGDPFTRLPSDCVSHQPSDGHIHSTPFAGNYWLICNTEFPHLKSANIRKAIAYAINRQEITENVALGYHAAFSIAPEMLSFLSHEEKTQDFNVHRARYFFEQGLEELGMSSEEFPPIELAYCPMHKEYIETIQEQLRKNLGVAVKLQCQDWNVCVQNYTSHNFQVGYMGWFSSIEDPIFHLHPFQFSSNASNWTGWEHPEYQMLISRADGEYDEVKRKIYLKQAEQVLLEEMPVIPLYSACFRYLDHPKVEAPPFTAVGELDLKWVFMKAEMP